MHYVHHGVDERKLRNRRIGNRLVTKRRKALVPEQSRHGLVQAPVRQGDRLVDAAGRAGGVGDQGIVPAAPAPVNDGGGVILAQQLVHKERAAAAPELPVVHLAEQCEFLRHIGSPGRGVGHDDAAQAQRILGLQDVPEDRRLDPWVAEDHVRNMLLPDHSIKLLHVDRVQIVEHRDGNTQHIQGVKHEDRAGGGRRQHPDAAVIRLGDTEGGEHLRVAIPPAEHLAIAVRPLSLCQGDRVQMFVAVGVQLPDKLPAFLLNDRSACDTLVQRLSGALRIALVIGQIGSSFLYMDFGDVPEWQVP